MKAILIDPFNETVTEVDHSGNYKEIYKLLSHPKHPVSCFTVIGIENEDAIYLDDEGLLKDPKHFFVWEGYPQPLAGKGLILGTNDEGDSISPVISLGEARKRLSFHHDIRLLDFENFEGVIDHPVLGKDTHVFGHRPIFVKAPEEPDDKM